MGAHSATSLAGYGRLLTFVDFDIRLWCGSSQQIEKLFEVTADEVMSVARQFDLTKVTILALGPLEKI